MPAMAPVAGADAIIACFDAEYHHWSWRPYQAIAGLQPLGARYDFRHGF
jgi:hypothetical protein